MSNFIFCHFLHQIIGGRDKSQEIILDVIIFFTINISLLIISLKYLTKSLSETIPTGLLEALSVTIRQPILCFLSNSASLEICSFWSIVNDLLKEY